MVICYYLYLMVILVPIVKLMFYYSSDHFLLFTWVISICNGYLSFVGIKFHARILFCAICFLVQLDFYIRFMKSHVECKVDLRAFERLKAYHVRRLKEHNTCACKHHTKMVELRHGFNNMRTTSKGIYGRMCPCSYNICYNEIPGQCNVKWTQFPSLTKMWNSIICPLKPNSIWHNLICLKGKCLDYGNDMLMTCPFEEDKHLAFRM